MAEAKFDLLSLLQKGGSMSMATEDNVKKWFEDLGLAVDGKIDNFLYKVDPEVLLKEISKEQLKALLKTTFVTKDGKTYRFDLLKCMEENPALARFIVREFGVEGCKDFGFDVNAKINETFVSMGKKALENDNWDVSDFKKNLQNLLLLLPETELVRVVIKIDDEVAKLTSKINGYTGLDEIRKMSLGGILDKFKTELFAGVSEPIRNRLNAVYLGCNDAAPNSLEARIKEFLENKTDCFVSDDAGGKKMKENPTFSDLAGAFGVFNGDGKDKKEEREFLKSKMTEHDGVGLQEKRKEEAKEKIKGELKGFFKINTDDEEFSDEEEWKNFIKEKVKKYVERGEDDDAVYEGRLNAVVEDLCGILKKDIAVPAEGGTGALLSPVFKVVIREKEGGGTLEIEEGVIDTLINIVNDTAEGGNKLTTEQAETLKKFLRENGVDLDLLGKESAELKFIEEGKDVKGFNEEGKIFIENSDNVFACDKDGQVSVLKESFVGNFIEECMNHNIDMKNSPLSNIGKVYVLVGGEEVSLLEKAVELYLKDDKQAKRLLEFLSQEQSLSDKHLIDEETAKRILGKDIKNINDKTLLDLFVGDYGPQVIYLTKPSPFAHSNPYDKCISRLLGAFDKVAFGGEGDNRKLKEDFTFFDKKGEKRPFTRKLEELAYKIEGDINLVLDDLKEEEKKEKLKDIFGVEKIEDVKIIKLLECIRSTKTKEEKEKELKEFFGNKDNSIEAIKKGIDKLKKLAVEVKKNKDEKRKIEEKDKREKEKDEEIKKLREQLKTESRDRKKIKTLLAKYAVLLQNREQNISKLQERFNTLLNENRKIKEELAKANRDQGRADQKRTQETGGQQYRDSRDNYCDEQINRVAEAILTAENKKELEINLENVRNKVSPEALVNGMLEAIQRSVDTVRTKKDQFEFDRLKDFAEIISTRYRLPNIETKQVFEKLFNSVGISLNSQNQGQNQPAYGQPPVVQQPIQPQNQPVYGQIQAQQNNTFNIQQPQDAMSLLTALLLPTYMQHLAQMNTVNNRFNIIQPLLANMMLMSTAATALLANNAGINLGR